MKRAAKTWTPLKTKNNKHSVVVEFICPGVNVRHSAILGGAQEAEPALASLVARDPDPLSPGSVDL